MSIVGIPRLRQAVRRFGHNSLSTKQAASGRQCDRNRPTQEFVHAIDQIVADGMFHILGFFVNLVPIQIQHAALAGEKWKALIELLAR